MVQIDFDTRLGRAIGDSSAKQLEKAFGYRAVGDLLSHYPRRYVDLAHPESFDQLVPGQLVALVATVTKVEKRSFANNPRKFRTHVSFTDGTRELDAVFFNQYWVQKAVAVGSQQLISGEVGSYNGRPQLTHPKMNELPEGQTLADTRMGRPILPIYAAVKNLTTWEIEETINHLFRVVDVFPEPLNEDVRAARSLPDAAEAYRMIHRPETPAEWKQAQARFRFQEAFELQAVFAKRRHEFAGEDAVAYPPVADGIRSAFEARLPFTLTSGQQAVLAEISADLSQPHPMHRLLQGDVGSGKTIVALLAMLQVVDAGAQAALLAPTEVLAVQHFRNISNLLGELAEQGMLGAAEASTRVQLLTGSLSEAERKVALLEAASGRAGIVIGTHALIQDKVSFADLGLAVIDEQHRFGVDQRSALVDRAGGSAHALVMTATPIPRTIAMTVFGDLDVSTLSELPAGRTPIATHVVAINESPDLFHRTWQRVAEEVAKGRQAYGVVSRIGEDEPDGEESATRSLVDVEEWLRSGPLNGVRVESLHGRMAADLKDERMSAFSRGEVDVLVATTVIEVGVDVPNATMMVIVDADRFGISQLHQLRGRVGRGSEPGLCVLLTEASADSPARERLAAVASTTDGFELARLDVELRREGDV
ncbi:MAG: ATP-dependent DNA helicase RecG, partial [Actinomycetales bacterium]|nr:ATP-dependent DNA helicase RecG [Actinomycetales bacterium]